MSPQHEQADPHVAPIGCDWENFAGGESTVSLIHDHGCGTLISMEFDEKSIGMEQSTNPDLAIVWRSRFASNHCADSITTLSILLGRPIFHNN